MTTALRKLQGLSYRAGERRTYPIPKRNALTGLRLSHAGTLVVTGGTGAGTVLTDHPYRHYAEISVSSTRKGALGGPIIVYAGTTLYFLDQFFQPNGRHQDVLADDAAGSDAIEFNVRVPLNLPGSIDPEFAYLDTTRMPGQGPELAVRYAALGALIDGEDATGLAITDNPDVTVHEELIAHTTRGSVFEPWANTSVTDVNASSSNFMAKLPEVPSDVLVAHVLVEAQYTPTSELRATDALFNELELQLGGVTMDGPVTWNQLRSQNRDQLQLSARVSGAALFTAMPNGIPNQLWPVGTGESVIVGDVTKQTGVNRVRTSVIGVRPVRGV